MSSIDKSIASILEGSIESMDYGVPEFNKLFKSLDSKTKKKLINDFPPDKPDNKDIHIGNGGSGSNKVRYPSKKRPLSTWRRFYKLFPYYAERDNFDGKTSDKMK